MDINILEATPDNVKFLLRSAYARNKSVMLWGEPGIGKSSLVKEFAKEEGANLIDIRLTTLEPSDLRGLPCLDLKEKRTTWLWPEFVPVDGKKTFLFLDEITSADPRLQAAAYEIVLDRSIGGKPLPANIWVVAAGNRLEDGAISFNMGTALADRFQHILMGPDVRAWLEWGQKTNIHPSVLTFIKIKGQYLSRIKEGLADNKMVVPTPRSWENISLVLKHHDEMKASGKPYPDGILRLDINGYIGKETTQEFLGVLEEVEMLPPIDELLKASPEDQLKMIPDNLTAAYALAYSVTAYCDNLELLKRGSQIFLGLPDARRASKVPYKEIKTVAMDLLLTKAIRLEILKEFTGLKEIKTYMQEYRKATTLAAA